MSKQTSIGTGYAWPKLEPKVDNLVENLMKNEKLPGMTVAVTKNGRLILTKGYGLANTSTNKAMEPFMRIKIGSVTKAVITGPSGFQLMKSKNIDPTSTKLYGPKGLFGGVFDADIDIGVKLGIKENKPNAAKWKGWYEKITLQNLLDHRAGFIGSGDEPGAAKMFGVSGDELTYEQVHRHFLRTKSIYEPGTTPSAELLKELGKDDGDPYSNHGFGLWTLLIQKMSGESYRSYVMNKYLRPLGLHMYVLPERANPDSSDAWNHRLNSKDEAVPFAFEESGLGLAAGGFRASAQDLARLMVHLESKYTQSELDSMGWAKEERGKLHHNGLIGGGTAYVVMFPNGYKSKNNLDLSRVHVALVTNIRNKPNLLEDLSSKIALEVPVANVPEDFSILRFLRHDTDTGGEFSEVSIDGSVAAFSNSKGNLQIIPYLVNDRGSLTRGEVLETGTASEVNFVHPHPASANAVTALRDLNANLKVIAWEIAGGGQVTRKGDAVAGPVKSVAVTSFPDGKGVITATRGNQDDFKLVAWELTPSLELVRRGDIAAGAVKHIAVTVTHADFSGVVSATTGNDTSLKLIAWKFDSKSKTFSRKGDASAGAINGELNVVRAPLSGKDIVVTALKDGGGDLRLIGWEIDSNGQIARKGSATAGPVSLVDLTAGRDGQVFTSVKDGDGNLRMIAYKVQDNGQIERIGTGVAGEIRRIASSYIRRNGREFLLTAVQDSEKKLRVISWELD